MSQTKPRSGPTRSAAAVVVLLLLASGCSFDRGGATTHLMQLTVTEGPASLVHEGKSRTVTGSAEVAAGDSVILGKGARGELRLAEGRSLDLAAAKLSIASPTSIKISGGDILAVVSKALTIDTESVVVNANRGAVRIEKALATRVANYGPGPARVAGAADELVVPRYRQATIAGGIVPRAPKPIQIDPKDEWDQKFLQSAVDLDGRLANFARGLEAQLGTGTGVEFFQTISPLGTDLSFLGPYLSGRRSDLLIGLILAAQAQIPGAELSQRFVTIFELWNQGATWGLIASEFSVAQDGVFGKLLEAVQLAGLFSPTGAGPGLARRPPGRRGPRTPSPSPSPKKSNTTSPGPPSPPTPCSQEPQPPECLVPTTGTIIDDLFGDDPQGSGSDALGMPIP